MNLPVLNFLKKKPKQDYFIALFLKPKEIIAILLINKESKLNILSTKSVSLDLESATIEDMISSSDEAISSIELSIDEENKLEKTIFSVPYTWTDKDGSIKKERLLQLKKLSIELALKPMGFILNIEALIKYLQDKEGVLTTAIFVEETKNKIHLYLVRGGNILEVQSGEINDDIEKVVEHTLKKVEKFETLPSKMILLHHEDIESRQQKFLTHHWTKDLPFLHLPQISLLEKGFETEAIVNAIASQLDSRISNVTAVSGAELIESEGSSVTNKNENFGFVREKDVAEIKEEKAEIKEEPVVRVHDRIQEEDKKESFYDGSSSEDESTYRSADEGISALKKISGLLSLLTGRKSKTKMLLIPILAVVFFAILMTIYYLLFLKVEITIYTGGDKVKDEVLVELSEEEETSFEDKILHIDPMEHEISGKVSKSTTGIEEVGEKASGEVTVFNKTDKEIALSKGTVIVSSNDLGYILDSEIKIASTSSFSTDISSSKVKIKAEKFGKEYNLPSNTNFTIEDYNTSEAFAKNEVAFSGGTKEENKIVAEEDIDTLEEELIEKNIDQALNEAGKGLGENEQIISVVLNSSIEEPKFSSSKGEKASKIELSGTVLYTLGIYNVNEAKKFINESRRDLAPEGFVISEDDSVIKLANIEKGAKKITGNLLYEVFYKPDVKLSNIEESIKGKSISNAQNIIKEIEGITEVDIVFTNKLPLLPLILPLRSEQIQITYSADKP